MKTIANHQIGTAFVLATLIVICSAGCDYDVPITAQPTRKVEEKLLGDWALIEENGSTKYPTETSNLMNVRKFDESNYALNIGGSLYRAFHSDVGKTPFVSVEIIEHSNRKFSYLTWALSEDGKQLRLMKVNRVIVDAEQNNTSAKVQKILKENLKNPDLFRAEDVLVFTNKSGLSHGFWK